MVSAARSRRPATPAKRLRVRLELTQAAFARLLGVDLRSVIRWEHGQVPPSGAGACVLLALTTALDRAGRAEPEMMAWLQEQARLGTGLTHVLLTLLTKRFCR